MFAAQFENSSVSTQHLKVDAIEILSFFFCLYIKKKCTTIDWQIPPAGDSWTWVVTTCWPIATLHLCNLSLTLWTTEEHWCFEVVWEVWSIVLDQGIMTSCSFDLPHNVIRHLIKSRMQHQISVTAGHNNNTTFRVLYPSTLRFSHLTNNFSSTPLEVRTFFLTRAGHPF